MAEGEESGQADRQLAATNHHHRQQGTDRLLLPMLPAVPGLSDFSPENKNERVPLATRRQEEEEGQREHFSR